MRMPEEVLTGNETNMPIETFISHPESVERYSGLFITEGRFVLGYRLPEWQRPAVWSEAQQVKFIESIWLGLSLGSLVITQRHTSVPDPLDNLLIDGQQRLTAIEEYVHDKFKVFGALYSELDKIDQRRLRMRAMGVTWLTRKMDEDILKDLYIRLNYGGTAHAPEHHPNLLTP